MRARGKLAKTVGRVQTIRTGGVGLEDGSGELPAEAARWQRPDGPVPGGPVNTDSTPLNHRGAQLYFTGTQRGTFPTRPGTARQAAHRQRVAAPRGSTCQPDTAAATRRRCDAGGDFPALPVGPPEYDMQVEDLPAPAGWNRFPLFLYRHSQQES